MLWGAIVVAGNLFAVATPRWAGVGWLALDALGAAATFAMLRNRAPQGAPISPALSRRLRAVRRLRPGVERRDRPFRAA